MIHAEALKRQIPSRAIMRLHGAGEENRAFHRQIFHPVLHYAELESDHACDLDRAAEANLAVALAEMKVANAELGPLDVDGEEDFAAAAEILDVAVPAVFRAAGYGACPFPPDLVFDVPCRGTGVHVLRLGWERGDPVHVRSSGDELALAFVPQGEDFSARCTA